MNKGEPGLVILNTTMQYNGEAGRRHRHRHDHQPGGLVLTNNHVIEDSTKHPATVIGYDKTGDVALIRLQGASGLTTVPVGNSATIRTGTSVVAMGNAEGQGAIIPAAGRVTGLGKTITASDQGGTATTENLHG